MLFTGVVVHMLAYSNLNIAITSMIKLRRVDANQTHPYVAFCRVNDTQTNSGHREVHDIPVRK